MFKTVLKKIIPKNLLNYYYQAISQIANFLYGQPSHKLIVIGVTGTNGKSTVVDLISHFLEKAGHKVGATSTVSFKIGNQEWLNNKKMTMLGRFALQKMIHKMVKEKCTYAIIETSSEGVKQFRHLGINYDVVVFTNLTPEHIEAHGSFENYKKAKLELFKHLTKYDRKEINGQEIKKIIVANRDDKYFNEFFVSEANQKLSFSINKDSDFQAQNLELKPQTKFKVNNVNFQTNILGQFNVYNILTALAACSSQNISLERMSEYLNDFEGTPGRMEFINQGQDFKVLIDYAPEIESLKQLYKTLDLFYYERLIHVLGSCGGGRDKKRQPILGNMAGEKADIVIITNEDPYDDIPMKIIDNVAQGATENGKILDKDLFKIEDRREAIKYALNIAQEGDLVLLTGKGAEQFICIADGEKIPWDEREVVRELLKK
ncbi:UDP-N-acetylmuramoyl-L-alanyl-D-glutamate--2,6-diaminopimelate ligase [bacterium]|nr:UDP-N-acetylmuramoyl-L-alanyl-D-glutamate--2,6-diaminopimelate ligase [bacterium]